MQRSAIIAIIIAITMSSCLVGKKKFDQSVAENQRLQTENEVLQEKLDAQTKENVDLTAANQDLTALKTQLEADTADCGNKLRNAQKQINDLNKLYDDLNSKSKQALAKTAQENQKLQLELADKQRELQDKEKSLNDLQVELQEREKRLNELNELLAGKDKAINDLKKSIENALLNFNKDELTVQLRDGKIYVSLAEQLLFKSGSTSVDPKGEDALTKLASALQNQTDIDILIEGHTDSIPIKTSCIKDNWDLSVLRATSIVRILTDAGIPSDKIVPSGRGEFKPVAPNTDKDGRALNRRTEIILSPKLDEVFKILDSK